MADCEAILRRMAAANSAKVFQWLMDDWPNILHLVIVAAF
jgi:hypothetical protein